MKRRADEIARKNPPGSKAGPRREWAQNRWEQLLAHGNDNVDSNKSLPALPEGEEYTYEDAVIEDLIGNTSNLTSQPTPKPVYLGHRHREFYNRVADQMDEYRSQVRGDDKEDNTAGALKASISLPSDKDISNALRSYRDRHGTRQKPIGAAQALQHLLQDLGVPIKAFDEFTFTTLVMCCRTPQEGRRIFKLMRDNNHEISSYSWSILVDIHAKLGDFEGCGEVLKEMVWKGGHAPTQAAYTSLLAACYKICQDSGRIPIAVRRKAWDSGWRYWQELRIVGIEPDVMAYGAILRLCSVTGRPERAIGLLEDMERFEVKPTTLCFTAALRAVAKSHETAIRFEKGWSKVDMKRESVAAHHGKMARQIVILADTAEVQHDDGFISALMLCAAAAGDSATTKAILLASEVRKIDHLRTIGGSIRDTLDDQDNDLHVSRNILQQKIEIGEHSTSIIASSDENDIATKCDDINLIHNSSGVKHKYTPTFSEREYGKDTRVFSALIHSYAQAMNSNGIGTIWAGRENLGFLCDNSLRLITTRWDPSYRDTTIPGMSTTKIGIGALRRMDERDDDDVTKPGKRKQFRGLYVDEDDLVNIDDFDNEIDPIENTHNDTNNLSGGGVGNLFTDNESLQILPEINDTMNLNENMEHDSIDSVQSASSKFFDSNDENIPPTSEGSNQLFERLKDLNEIDERLDFNDTKVQELIDAMHGDFAADTREKKSEITIDNDIASHDFGFSEDKELIQQELTKDAVLSDLDPGQLSKIEDLQIALPGMPIRRLKRILDAYEDTLGNPSMLTLIPILRETMPDRLTSGWLKRNNKKNADFAFIEACKEGSVNSALLNSMVEVKANSGSLTEALEYHAEQFTKHKLTPSAYSDRLIFQMLVANKRLNRALEFKQKIDEDGRFLDIASYGSLVEYYGRHEQIGSAFLFLKECIAKHGTAPSEACLSKLRSLCVKKRINDDMIGVDPKLWLRHGQKYLKRESSKKGMRNIKKAQNRLLS